VEQAAQHASYVAESLEEAVEWIFHQAGPLDIPDMRERTNNGWLRLCRLLYQKLQLLENPKGRLAFGRDEDRPI